MDIPRPANPEARALLDRTRRGWIDRLIDRSRRNNLLYFRPLRAGTLELTGAAAEALDALLSGGAVPLSRLVPQGEDIGPSAARVQAIRRKSAENLEERGLETLFLTVGMASWTPDDGGRPPEAPVLLLPVSVEMRGRDPRTATLRRDGDPQVNSVLLFELATAHGRALEGDALLGLSSLDANGKGNGAGEEAFDPEPVFDAILRVAGGIPGFTIRGRVVLGNFAFQKMAMVKDLAERGEEMAAHPVIAAIAGDVDAAVTLRTDTLEMDPRLFDRIAPDDEFFVLDADPSQLAAIASVLSGQNVVIFGPPGTGKSQTIANLVAAMAAEGKRVLFVAEKRAALEAVYKRLEATGVGHLALDLHGADIKRRVVIERLRRARDTVRRSPEVPATETHRRFVDRRDRLVDHDERLHAPRPPSGHSAFDLQGTLLRHTGVDPATRWRGRDLDRLDRDNAEAIQSRLRALVGFSDLLFPESSSPWRGADLPDGDAAQAAVDIAHKAHRTLFPALRTLLAALCDSSGLPAPATVNEAESLVDLLEGARDTLGQFGAGIFHEGLPAMAHALAPAAHGFWPRLWAFCTSGAYRAARTRATALRSTGPVPPGVLHNEVAAAAGVQARWRDLRPDGVPVAVPLLPEARTALTGVAAALDALTHRLDRDDLRARPLPDIASLLEGLSADTVTPFRIPEMLALSNGIRERGGGAILDEIEARRLSPESWEEGFRVAWLTSCLDRVRAEDPAIGAFSGRVHDGYVAEFRALDAERLRLAAARLRREHGERVTAVMDAHPDQALLVNREVEKKSRHMPLRDLLSSAPEVLTALCPCWMASPLSVSQLLPADRRYFDVVVFDEASQVLPEDAVAAILRGGQVVIAGDEHQLPPTTFFADAADEEESLPTTGFESLLTVAKPYFAHGALRVHYRSRDESLIAFSNAEIYRPHGHEMVTFPGPDARGAVHHVLVPPDPDGDEESTSAEVRRVVDLVIQHAIARPDESLGVIAFGMEHAARVQAALDAALLGRPELDPFFDPSRPEPFFVKNLERVQGDERDAILLTVGYAKDRNGTLRYHFGPLNASDGSGYRRLNVAITRARKRMTVVSSFSHQDMDPKRCTAEGLRLLRAYLAYAANGKGPEVSVPGQAEASGFEADVREAMAAHGIRCREAHGASGARIDLAAEHPTEPGRLVLAIEGDGHGYHRQPTARMRERLRPERLEALGWRFHRIWSTDWFLRRDEEIARAVAAFQAAIADGEPAAGPEPEGLPGTERPQEIEAPVPPEPLAEGPAEAPPVLPPRPDVPVRGSIAAYHPSEIDTLVRWLDDTGCMTEREILARMVTELGFSRRGRKIEEAVLASIHRVRSTPPAEPPMEIGTATVSTSEGTRHRDVRVQVGLWDGETRICLVFPDRCREAGFSRLVRAPGFFADVRLTGFRSAFPGTRSRRYSGRFTWEEPGRVARADERLHNI